MQYIMTFVWAVVLVHTINFVLTSLGGGKDLNLGFATVASIIFGLLAIIIAHTIPNEPVPEKHNH